MSAVRVIFTKWRGRPHREFDTSRLGTDGYGLWLGVPTGTAMVRPGLEVVTTYDSVVLVPPDQAYVAMFMERSAAPDDPNPPCVYVDVTTSPLVTDTQVTAVDLDLDVIRRLDGTTFLDDEDEFAVHQVAYGYPADVVALAQESARQLLLDVRSHVEPFGSASRRWTTQLLGHRA